MSLAIMSEDSLAGPIVATIFVRLGGVGVTLVPVSMAGYLAGY
jgi:hypothetical protein